MAADNEVPFKFFDLHTHNVYSAEVPSSADWQHFAKNILWLKGRGSQLIPSANFQDEGYIASNQRFEYALIAFPRQQALERYWYIQAQGESAAARFHFNIDGTQMSTSVGVHGSELRLVQSLTQSTHSDVTFISLSGTFSGSGRIVDLSCFEAPRVRMDAHNAEDDIPNEHSVRNNYPIFSDPRTPAIDSVRAISTHVSSSIGVARRAGIFCWARPVRVNGALNTTTFNTTNTPRKPFLVPPRVQARRIYPNESTALLDVYVHGWIDTADQEIECTVSSSIASSQFYSLGSLANAPQWLSGTIAVRVDGTGSAGLPIGESVSDHLDFTFANTAGNGKIYITTIFVGERESPK